MFVHTDGALPVHKATIVPRRTLLGPLISLNEDQPSSFSEFRVDQIMKEGYQEPEQLWFKLNIPKVVADKLSGRSPYSEHLR